MIGNLLKAAVGVVVLPVAVAVDLVTLPSRAFDNKSPLDASERVVKAIGANVKEALDP